MDIADYLTRIGLEDPPPLNRDGLEILQRAHLTHVPFENLDIYHRRGVRTDTGWSIPKIIDAGRGGWCFELNCAFATLLEALGFEVTLLGATALLESPPDGPQPDHAIIRVDLDRPYLVDVGFGDSFIRPLPLDHDGPHDGGAHRYGFGLDGGLVTLYRVMDDGRKDQYRFGPGPVVPADFDPSNHHLQTSPGVHFQEAPFATRLLDGGPDRVTLVHDRLKLRRDGRWTHTPVSAEEWPSVLRKWFGIDP